MKESTTAPKPARKKIGRPEYKPSPALRAQVAVAAGGGARHCDIAVALGISVPTLRKHFEAELSVVAAARRLEVLRALFRAAKKGNVAAAKAYLALEPESVSPPAEAGAPGEPAAAPATKAAGPAGVPLGKKEQAAADAVTAAVGTEWDSLLPKAAPLQ